MRSCLGIIVAIFSSRFPRYPTIDSLTDSAAPEITVKIFICIFMNTRHDIQLVKWT